MSVESVEFVRGPLVSEFTREAAEKGLRQNTKFGPKIASGAAYALDEVEGRWVAAIVVEADSPFGGPADQSEEAPAPKSEGPDDTAAPEGGEEPKGDSEGGESEGPEGLPGEGGEHKPGEEGKGGKEELIIQTLDAICQALGIPNPSGAGDTLSPDASPLGPGGPDGAIPPPPPGPAGPGAGGPPGGGIPGHGPGDQHIVHEKALKPGEVPPGGTPIGAPAFSHVREDHPWKHVAGKLASIVVANPIGDAPIADVHDELSSLANELGGGYKVTGLQESYDESGQRIAHAVISMH